LYETVSDVLAERSRGSDSVLGRMMVASLLAHAVVVSALVAMPASWRTTTVPPEAKPMMISLSGGTGPDAGGMTPMADKPVQVQAPPEAKPRNEPPPAPKAPEMVAPEPSPKVVPKTPSKPVDKPVDKATSRRPTTGPELKTGDSRVATGGAAIPFGGLTRPSGGGMPNSGAFTDYANFCCPAYLSQMTDLIRRNWNQNQGASGQVQVKFTIARDGTLSDVVVEKSSGVSLLDLESQRAVLKVRQLPALPREFTENTLTVHLVFEYHR
jgi:periplasmic protein TonB